MKSSRMTQFALAIAVLCLAFGTRSIAAQDVTHPSTTETTGSPEHVINQTQVKNAEVIHVSGHHIVVELENGGFELLNLPPDFKFQVDGRDLNVHELTPGTKLTQEIHTVTTPQEVTTLRTLNGRVFHVNPPHLIVSLPEGRNREFTVPDDAVFHINGEDKTVFDLREGMNFSATVLKVEPVNSVTRHTVVTGQAPPKPDVAFEGPLLIEPVVEPPASHVATATEEPVAQELPRTGSFVPLIALLGLFFIACYAALRMIRSNNS
jgi:hypothetical protein